MIEINRNPSRRVLRQFAVAFAVFAGLAGWLILHETGSPWAAAALWALGSLVGVAGLARPNAVRLVYLALTYAAYPVGLAVSTLVLAAIYFFVLTPIGVMMKIGGRDSLQRKPDRSASTYWTPHKGPDDTGRYFHQF